MSALLEIRGLVKDYQSLRPLRVRELRVTDGEVLSVAGLDGPSAEMFVHLLTGAALPDEGHVALLAATPARCRTRRSGCNRSTAWAWSRAGQSFSTC